jgi:4-hydroxy-3-polyprenylbenzoate decarboxylase
MAFSSLRDFIFNHLEPKGNLIRVSEPVRPFLEMTEIQTRLLAERGPAVLFENPVREDGTPYGEPV